MTGSSRPSSGLSTARPTAGARPPRSIVSARRSSGRRRCWPMSASSRMRRPTSSRQSARSSPGTGASSMPSRAEAWIASLTPWPAEFGLGRMRALLAELGDPQQAYPAIHVVGRNGKSPAPRRAAAFLAREGLLAGAYTSPHVSGWSERIQVGGENADFDAAIARVRPAAEPAGATQFEALTAAALAAFAAAGVDVAVVEAGLGGRLDATNVLDARVVALTNIALDHTEVLGETRDEIAREKLAVVAPGATVVLGEPEWEDVAHARGADRIVHAEDVGRAAAEQFLGRELGGDVEVDLPGRFEARGEDVFAGAHNPAGGARLGGPPSRDDHILFAGGLARKDAPALPPPPPPPRRKLPPPPA